MTGIIGRHVSVQVKRGDEHKREACEVMACMTGGEYGRWWILVSTHDGTLLSVEYTSITLMPIQASEGPYR